ncbi:MAG: stage V sporulation protein AD [Ruminococcaceae bacterium]|nr:stage V sporulation protein AD [Oscillospiraceae bacterium]
MAQGIIRLQAKICAWATAVGKKESEGPLGSCFDLKDPTDQFGQKTWEAAESEMQRRTLALAIQRRELKAEEIDFLFAGDLLNQCVASAYGLLEYPIPYCGIYGACSTSAEGLLLAGIAVSGGMANWASVVTSSHNSAAERQYRTPLEYGAQRSPTAQWTVTGAGAFLVGKEREEGVSISRGMVGIPRDSGVKDTANMGGAMAIAAADTLKRFFDASGASPADYDRIISGDLGYEGGSILCDLMKSEGIDIQEQYSDCGQLIFDRERQDVHSGGSGCGCAAVTLGGYLLPRLWDGIEKKILFLPTGALMSPDSIKQGRTIPAVAHLVELESRTPRENE